MAAQLPMARRAQTSNALFRAFRASQCTSCPQARRARLAPHQQVRSLCHQLVGISGPSLSPAPIVFLGVDIDAIAPLLAWVLHNTAAHTRRTIAIATAFICTNSGAIVSTWIFPTSDAPYYPFASKFILSMILISMGAGVVELMILRRLNRRKEDPAYTEKLLGGMYDLDLAQQMVRLGDAHPDYKCIL